MEFGDRLTHLLQPVESYYSAKARRHGATAPGVDWNSESSQRLRFDQLLRIIQNPSKAFSIIDYGCGYGALVDAMVARGHSFTYMGYDISEEMIALATARHRRRPDCRFSADPRELAAADYTVASGIFNVKLGANSQEWERYVLQTISRLAALSTAGFAFNALTRYSDPARMNSNLYYADPCLFFDHCKRNHSASVALLHDYGLYEFTILVRKDEGTAWHG